jgi:hypothetical protein
VRALATILCTLGGAAAVGFIADLVIGARGSEHSSTARDILFSAAAMAALLAVVLAEVVFAPSWMRWVPEAGTGLLASVVFPLWWFKHLRRR